LLFVSVLIALPLTLVGFESARRPQFPSLVSNLYGVDTIKYLSATSRDAARLRTSAQSLGGCPPYPAAVAFLKDSRVTTVQKLEFLDTRSGCWAPARPALAAGWRAEVLWELGRDEEACRLLTDLKSAARALEYARQSIEAGNWPRGTAYLQCLEEIVKQGIWVSPWKVAELYQRLGQHYENVGRVDDAIVAYGEASYWHPGVWAMPYVRKAQLLRDQGKTSEAIDWLVAGIPRCTDATSTFYLWQEFGEFMVARGADVDGLCAYQRARDVMDQVPSQNLPDSVRQLTQERLNALTARVGAARSTCFADYPELLAQ
jgi:tetratricopeptide (TPR) repeat protein